MSGWPHAPALLPVVLAATLGAGLVARTPQPVPRQLAEPRIVPPALDKYTADWRAAAQAHVGSSFDEPAAAIAAWPNERTRAVVVHAVGLLQAERQAERARDDGNQEVSGLIAKGLLLHTDIAIAERTGEARTAAGPVDPVLLDALPLASRRFSVHWSHARVLADALAKAPPMERTAIGTTSIAIARAWYRAVAALFQWWADLGHLDAHFSEADAVVGEDPVLLLYQGTLYQTYADPRLQAYRTVLRRSRGLVLGASLPFADAGAELARADRALRRALALETSLVEARIRLAHVQDARGRPAEAAALAREALAGPLPPFLEYYGAMVLGRAESSLGHLDQARAAYERAAARYPRSQATQVALSHVPLNGSPGMAAEGLVRELGPDGQDVEDDPWAEYFRLHEPTAPRVYDKLRTSVP